VVNFKHLQAGHITLTHQDNFIYSLIHVYSIYIIQGEKYFVLKRPKEAPAVLRKPASKPPRPHPSSHKSRPMSQPVMRNAKMFEDMLSSQINKGHPPGSVGHAAEVEKENCRGDVKGLARDHMRKTASVDSIDVSP